MDSSIVEHSPPPNVIGRPALANLLAQVALALFLITFAVIGAGYRGSNAFIKTQLSVTILFMMAATSTLVSLRRQLPSQNVILASLLVMLTGLAVQAVGISMDIGFSLPHPRRVKEPSVWFGELGQFALVWLVTILNCRGVVRLVMRRWRLAPLYGFWVMGGTVILAVLFIVTLARFGPAQWDWRATMSIPWSPVWTLVTLVLVTPMLINKKPVPQKENWHPLAIWVAFNLWFVAAAFAKGGYLVSGLIMAEIFTVLMFVLRDRRFVF